MWSPSRISPLSSSQSHGCVRAALISGEGWLTLWQYFALLWFGGSFCFGGCFGKTVYKLIFVVLVFKAKKKKTKPFGNCTASLRWGSADLWRRCSLKGALWGLPLSRVQAHFTARFVLSAPDSLTEHLHPSCTFSRCAGQPEHTA